MAKKDAFIRLVDIKKDYVSAKITTKVIRGVSVTINYGEYISIMAPSGMGKTTLMHIIGLLDSISSGTYILNNEDVSSFKDKKASMIRNKIFGFVFQQFFLIDKATVMENVLLPTLYSKEKRDYVSAARDILDTLGLGDRVYYKANELSGGQKQRVAIARALINNPECVLADEPTGNLDSQATEEVLKIFDRIHSDGKTIIMVTHDPQVAKRADKIIKMKDGLISEILSNDKPDKTYF